MKSLFQLKNHELFISPEALAIDAFSAIWKRDKSKDKNKAYKELAFVFYMEDYRTVYNQYIGKEREEIIKTDLKLPKEWEPDEKVKLALDKYRELNTTMSMELLEDALFGVNKLREYFKGVDFLEVTKDGRMAHDPAKFKGVLKDLPEIVKSLKKLREEIRQELDEDAGVRGQVQKGMFEDV